jgi:glycosyltransferase involved in cell wall biosynthesis
MVAADVSRTGFNLAVVCGDGLPISGLLTTFRNAVELIEMNLDCPQFIKFPIHVDFGYSWRPDKAAFFPRGPANAEFPAKLKVSTAVPVWYPNYGEDLLEIRRAVAQDTVDEELLTKIDAITTPYEQYFERWLEENDIDWVCAINMTLSDSVSVSMALHRAGERRWGSGRPGGILFWDHDLFRSYAVHEGEERVYPVKPNALTPVPQNLAWHEWAIVSEVLAPETKHYPTTLQAKVVPNVLPKISEDLSPRTLRMLSDFLESNHVVANISDCPPIILCPVRIFPVKGVEISIRVFACIRKRYREVGKKSPFLFIFGDPEEDPTYAAELHELARSEGVLDGVRFLGGVPLYSHEGTRGPKLDEKDLLTLCSITKGGVLFTPKVTGVESVGLGPALASLVGVPCVVSEFNALKTVYGDGFNCVRLKAERKDSYIEAARAFVELAEPSTSDQVGSKVAWQDMAKENREALANIFPESPWKELLLTLAEKAGVSKTVLERGRAALCLEY